MIYIVAALGNNNAIGKDGTIPWHIPDDLARFRILTTNKTVIMGRKTWESLPEKVRPLPNRNNIVVTSQKIDGVTTCDSLRKAIMLAKLSYTCDIFLIGGQRIYEEGMQYADTMYLTHVDADIEGADAFFPSFDNGEHGMWYGYDQTAIYSDIRPSCEFVIWRRKDNVTYLRDPRISYSKPSRTAGLK